MTPAPSLGHTRFRALGTDVFVAVRDARELAAATRLTRAVLSDVDDVASRFRPDTDLVAVNRDPGRWVTVDPLLVTAVVAAVAAAEATDGLVSPLLGRPLVELGYDRDFGALVERSDAPELVSPPPRLDAWREIGTDPAGRVRIPAGTALDLGSIGKAWAADLCATACERQLAAAALVSVGRRPADRRPRRRHLAGGAVRAARWPRHRCRPPRPRRARHVQHPSPPLGLARRTPAPPA